MVLVSSINILKQRERSKQATYCDIGEAKKRSLWKLG